MTADRYPASDSRMESGTRWAIPAMARSCSTHMGETLAEQMMGLRQGNPFDHLPWGAVPGHTGSPWFLPLVGLYYQILDKLK